MATAPKISKAPRRPRRALRCTHLTIMVEDSYDGPDQPEHNTLEFFCTSPKLAPNGEVLGTRPVICRLCTCWEGPREGEGA